MFSEPTHSMSQNNTSASVRLISSIEDRSLTMWDEQQLELRNGEEIKENNYIVRLLGVNPSSFPRDWTARRRSSSFARRELVNFSPPIKAMISCHMTIFFASEMISLIVERWVFLSHRVAIEPAKNNSWWCWVYLKQKISKLPPANSPSNISTAMNKKFWFIFFPPKRKRKRNKTKSRIWY